MMKKSVLLVLSLVLVVVVSGCVSQEASAPSTGVPKNPVNANGSEGIQSKVSSDITANATLDNLFYQFVSELSDLTDLQKEAKWKEYEGKYIKDSALVKDVKYEPLTGYVVSIGNIENQFSRGATIYFKDSEKDKLLHIQKDDVITFYGKLSDYSKILGIVIKDAEVRQNE